MISTQFSLSALAFSATISTLITGVDVAKEILAPPMIEGAGFYDGPAAPGETIMVDWVLSKRIDCPGYSSRVWANDAGFFLSEPVRATAIPVVEAQGFVIPTRVPETAGDGPIEMLIKGHFACEGQPYKYFTLGPVTIEVARSDDGAGR